MDKNRSIRRDQINGQRDESRREAFVAMVQPDDLWNGDDSSVLRRLDRTRLRTVFVQ